MTTTSARLRSAAIAVGIGAMCALGAAPHPAIAEELPIVCDLVSPLGLCQQQTAPTPAPSALPTPVPTPSSAATAPAPTAAPAPAPTRIYLTPPPRPAAAVPAARPAAPGKPAPASVVIGDRPVAEPEPGPFTVRQTTAAPFAATATDAGNLALLGTVALCAIAAAIVAAIGGLMAGHALTDLRNRPRHRRATHEETP